jgi:hypothetical protein
MADYHRPTQELVYEALRRIPTLQLRRAFFEGLKNPLWVEPLDREGVFRNPPEPEATEEGLIRDLYWPEIDYLIRAAPDAPVDVVDVLLTLKKSGNAWVRRGAFAIAAVIPADQAARLQPLFSSWSSTNFGWRTDPRHQVATVVNLLEGGQREAGTWLANRLFKPDKRKGKRGQDAVLEDYWLDNGLPRVVAALGDTGLSLVLPWLVAYERREGHLRTRFDITYMSRESIRERSSADAHLEQALIDATRDLAVPAMLADANGAVAQLLATRMVLGRKIAMYALAEALPQAQDGATRDSLLREASMLLFDEDAIDDHCRIEYAELARAVARRSPETLQPITEMFEAGPKVEQARLRRWLGRDDAAPTVVDERVTQYEDRWLHRWLSAIGPGALPGPLQVRLADLDNRLGVIEAPLAPRDRVISWVGPNSPLTLDEMSVMSPAELVAHLESWHDEGDGWGPEPSHEGQGRELTALLTTNPKAIAGVADLATRLRPTYLRAILRGWEAALKANQELEWDEALELVRGVLTHEDESPFPVEGGDIDDDVNFRWAKQAAIGLLEEIVKPRSAFEVPSEAMRAFADVLVSLADNEEAWSEYVAYDGDSDSDPLTVSLNWYWPMRVRGLAYLVAYGREAEWSDAARTAFEQELARDDVRGASRAVLGEAIGRLMNADPEWVQAHVADWFGGDDGVDKSQQIALSTAMAVYNYHSSLFDLLSSSMVALTETSDPITVGWRNADDPLQRVGEWIVGAIILGHITPDHLTARTFFSVVPAKTRGQAIGHIAWSFMHAEKVDDPIRDRLASLWDTRAEHVATHAEDHEELNEFYWFVKSGKFGVEWWLPRLKSAIELAPELSREHYMIGKEIAASADVDPRRAFEVLRALLDGRDEPGLAVYDLNTHAVPMVLARAMSSDDSELSEEARGYMNELGERSGNLRLEGEVRAVLDGIVSQDDVEE